MKSLKPYYLIIIENYKKFFSLIITLTINIERFSKNLLILTFARYKKLLRGSMAN